METSSSPIPASRLGFHYFPDHQHYRETDLQTWIPRLAGLGAAWLTIQAPIDRAVPEKFLRTLLDSGIEPILRIPHTCGQAPLPADVELLLSSYARWGVRYCSLFDRPNARASWTVTTWAQEELVERFLDRFVPLAHLQLDLGMIPVFPALEPGGSYWDTAFLRAALQSLTRRNEGDVLEKMVLSAYAWNHGKGIGWGAGGPERFPGARPYYTPEFEQDQRGFHIFDWYNAVTQSVLGHTLPTFLFGIGCQGDPNRPGGQMPGERHAQESLLAAQLLAGEAVEENELVPDALDPVPGNILAGNFWLLSTGANSPYQAHAWFAPDGKTSPAADTLLAWAAENHKAVSPKSTRLPGLPERAIHHYLLLPHYEWGVADWHLDLIRPYVKKYQPTIGFSVDEAAKAAQVTVLGGEEYFSDDTLIKLRSAGCTVERIDGNGTVIASIIAER